jgi:Ca-activated chloride channel family protein
MVVVGASVTDSLNNRVGGLEKEHFKVFENKVEQTITYFSSDGAPLSIGIIFDVSGSMAVNLVSARNSVVKFLRQGTPQDEYFLMTFNDRVTLAQDFTPATAEIRNQIGLVQAGGRTALYDAVYAGLQKLSEAHNARKALVVVTDGAENSSRYSFSDLREVAGESNAQIYFIGHGLKPAGPPIWPSFPQPYGGAVMNGIASLTGGRAFFTRNLNSLDYYFDLVYTELRDQYVLGYTPTNITYDGKWRRIRVQVNPPEGFAKVSVRARERYLAPRR